jgi:hypothetical protein
MNFINNVFLITDNDPAGSQEAYATYKVRLSYGTIKEHGSLTHFLYSAFDKTTFNRRKGCTIVVIKPRGRFKSGRRHWLELRMSF